MEAVKGCVDDCCLLLLQVWEGGGEHFSFSSERMAHFLSLIDVRCSPKSTAG